MAGISTEMQQAFVATHSDPPHTSEPGFLQNRDGPDPSYRSPGGGGARSRGEQRGQAQDLIREEALRKQQANPVRSRAPSNPGSLRSRSGSKENLSSVNKSRPLGDIDLDDSRMQQLREEAKSKMAERGGSPRRRRPREQHQQF